MICFLQREKDNFIAIIETEDIQQTLRDFEYKEGSISLLGTVPNGIYNLTSIQSRFIALRKDDKWYTEHLDILDFIDNVATFDDNALKSSAKYKSSDYTPIKQQSLHDALSQQLNLVVNITKNWNRAKNYCYFDLNAGPGISENGYLGSPLIFKTIADDFIKNWKNFRYDAQLYEADQNTFTKLIRNVGTDPRFIAKNESHEALNTHLKEVARAFSPKERKWVFGALYADPSNADLPWELLEYINIVYPRVDIMINIACASYKRTIASAGYQTLADRLPKVKEHWIVRRPYGKHQWSILIGTNWSDYPAWKDKQFFAWNDEGIGQSIFERLVYTPGQIQSQIQRRLFE